MKICDKCGHPNYEVKLDAKSKRVCEGCGKVMSEYAQCRPMLGGYDSPGCYSTRKIIDSDEI